MIDLKYNNIPTGVWESPRSESFVGGIVPLPFQHDGDDVPPEHSPSPSYSNPTLAIAANTTVRMFWGGFRWQQPKSSYKHKLRLHQVCRVWSAASERHGGGGLRTKRSTSVVAASSRIKFGSLSI